VKNLFATTTVFLLTLSACAGTTGPAGTAGTAGTDGTNGTDGTDGSNGAAGSDGGSSLPWTTISADATAQASHGYIAAAASAITLTLPPTSGLNPGDDVKLIVQGAADVSVAPNGAQTFDYDRGQLGWRPLAATPPVAWSQLAMSGDGTALVGMSGNSGLYRSGDSGATWSRLTGMTAQQLEAMAMSSDGSVINVGAWGNGFWYSTDSGTTWAQANNGPQYPTALAMSADGTKLFEVDDSNNWPFTSSTDSGADWSTVGNAPGYIVSLACSADCSSVFAVDEYGGVWGYRASSWTQLTTLASSGRVASSADGTTVVITVSSGPIVYSHDAGVTWQSASLPVEPWYPVAISADGTTMLASAGSFDDGESAIAMSKDSGVTWTVVDATSHQWQAVALTSDGARPLAISSEGGIYGQGNGSVLATHASELDFIYEGGGAFWITSDAATAYGPY
jgi:hypothetical protein